MPRRPRRPQPKGALPVVEDRPAAAPEAASLDAGAPEPSTAALAPWMASMRRALDGAAPADVPCGTCIACCTASQFVHVGPDETDARAHIPPALLFAAPGLPKGHHVLGYDDAGRCPLLRDGRCSIYAHRPRACRTYDCRVFAATGLTADVEQPAIRAAAARFTFTREDVADRAIDGALQAARGALAKRGLTPKTTNTTRLAVLVVETHDLALQRDPASGRIGAADIDADALSARLDALSGGPRGPKSTRR